MRWNEVSEKVAELYQSVASWVYDHPVETDILIVGAVVYGLYRFYKKQHYRRRRQFRIVRGCWMSRKERENYQRMRYEDAITNASLEMILEGRMSEKEEKQAYRDFAEGKYQLGGLVPNAKRKVHEIKRGIRTRIRFYRNKLKVKLPAGPPPLPTDPNYSGGAGMLAKSKYAKPPE